MQNKNNNEDWCNVISNKIQSFYSEVINKILPHAREASSFVLGSPDIEPKSFEGKISTDMLFKDSPYEYGGDGNFIHFSSLQGLITILNSGYLRMSEFGNLLDKQELIYGAKVFEGHPLFKLDISALKQNIFCLSACEANDLTKRNHFMWEVFASEGNGVIIEYKLTKKNPYSFILGKVQYGLSKLQPLELLRDLAIDFHKKKDFFPSNFMEVIMELQAFHKAKKYEIENEVRMFFREDKPLHEEHSFLTIYKDINSKNEIKYFNKLFLKGRHEFINDEAISKIPEDKILDIAPQIEITNIILGFNLSIENKLDIMKHLLKLKEKHHYEFRISHITLEDEIFQLA